MIIAGVGRSRIIGIVLWPGAVVLVGGRHRDTQGWVPMLVFPVRTYMMRLHRNSNLTAWESACVPLTIGPLVTPLRFGDSCPVCCAQKIAEPPPWCELLRYLQFELPPHTLLPLQRVCGAIAMNFRYPCVLPCQGQWNKPGPFNRHIQTCKHWQVHEENQRKQRAEVEAAQSLKKRRKLIPKKVL